MEILLSILIAPITFFAFKPIACGVVASALSVPVFLRNFSVGDRLFIGFVALVWWFFTWTEARTIVQTNIRVDLLFLGPIYLGLGVIAGWRILTGGDEPARARAHESAQAEMDAARETALSTPLSQVESARAGTVAGNPSTEAPQRAANASSWVSLKRIPKWLGNPWLVSVAVVGSLPFLVSGLLQMGSASASATFDEAKRMRFEAPGAETGTRVSPPFTFTFTGEGAAVSK